jgi:hypothetical protein
MRTFGGENLTIFEFWSRKMHHKLLRHANADDSTAKQANDHNPRLLSLQSVTPLSPPLTSSKVADNGEKSLA